MSNKMQKGEPVPASSRTCTCCHGIKHCVMATRSTNKTMLRLVRTVLLVAYSLSLLQHEGADACGPGRGGARRQVIKHRPPLVQRQHLPSSDEHTVGASGPPEGPIRRKDARFRELVQNWNPDIEFADQERTGADRMMSQRLKEKLSTLAISVMNRWPNVRLRVIEGWDEDNQHGPRSLHYEGRAVDITTSDRDRTKYGMLARLAVEAGFDWVHYEARTHVHCSVKSEKADIIRNNGCFDGASMVVTPAGNLEMSHLRLNDLVLAMDSATGKLEFSPVIMWLDRDEDGQELYVELTTSSGRLIRLTSSHLLYAAEEPPSGHMMMMMMSSPTSGQRAAPFASQSAGSDNNNNNNTDGGNYYYDTTQDGGSNTMMNASDASSTTTGDSQVQSAVDNVPNTNKWPSGAASVASESGQQENYLMDDVAFKTYARNLVVGQYLLVDPNEPGASSAIPYTAAIKPFFEAKVNPLTPARSRQSNTQGSSHTGRLNFRTLQAKQASNEEDDVQISDVPRMLESAVRFDQIVRVEYSLRKGIYAPLTREGNIVVNSVVVSCYAVIKDHDLAHLSFAPVRWLSYLHELVSGLGASWPGYRKTLAAGRRISQEQESSIQQQQQTFTQAQPKHPVNLANPGRRIHWYPTVLYKLGRIVLPTSYLY